MKTALALMVSLLAITGCVTKPTATPGTAAVQRSYEPIRNIRILSDSSVDCSTPESIAAATLIGDTDEAKILNFWTWYRRVEWHYKEWNERRDLTANLLSQGQTLCGSQAAVQMIVLRAGGYKTRPCFVKGGGHTFIEVFYDDRWHALDAMTGFYVYSRTTPRYILSLEEIKNDPDLVRTAVEEGRTPDVYFACAREQVIPKTKPVPWSHYLTFENMIEYYAEGSQTGKSGSDTTAYGGSYTPHKMDVNLLPGQRMVRNWDQETGRYPAGWAYSQDAATGPYHRCGHNDEFDEVNFPYWEPYLKKNAFVFDRKKTEDPNSGPITIERCYRYLTHGRFERALDSADIIAEGSNIKNIELKDSNLVATADTEGSLDILTTFPYFLCDADVTIDYKLATKNSSLILLAVPKGRGKTSGDPRILFETSRKRSGSQTVSIGRFDHKEFGPRDFTLRLLIKGEVEIKQLNVSSVFTHNMYTGPNLVPGDNKVTVLVDNPELLEAQPLKVTYVYKDGKNWKRKKTVSHEVRTSPFEFDIKVDGPKHPRILSVTVEALR